MNITHGAGATTTALTVAKFFAIQNFKTALSELSGNKDLEHVLLKDITYLESLTDVEMTKEQYNITVIDFGTPYKINKDGTVFKVEESYPIQHMKQFLCCNIKLIMCLDDDWHIGKLRFMTENESWLKQLDQSFLFLVPEGTDKIKRMYPMLNVFARNNSEYREQILEEFRKEE